VAAHLAASQQGLISMDLVNRVWVYGLDSGDVCEHRNEASLFNKRINKFQEKSIS
jgi:hypothetical protein